MSPGDGVRGTGRRLPLGLISSRCRGSYGIKKLEERVHTRAFQGVAESLIRADQSEAATISLMADIGADQRSDTRRINIGNRREVEDEYPRVAGSDSGLKIEEV